jgi:hypothetical protein
MQCSVNDDCSHVNKKIRPLEFKPLTALDMEHCIVDEVPTPSSVAYIGLKNSRRIYFQRLGMTVLIPLPIKSAVNRCTLRIQIYELNI